MNAQNTRTLENVSLLSQSFPTLPRAGIGRWACTHCAGPGYRLGVWTAGCDLRCEGCQTPDLQAMRSPEDASAFWVEFANTAANPALTGLTVSGGEPLLQPELVLCMLEVYTAIKTQLNQPVDILLYSHFLLEEIKKMPLGQKILSLCSVLIDGPFVQAKNDRTMKNGLAGSSNQSIHYLHCNASLQKQYEEYNVCRKVEFTGFRGLVNGIPCQIGTGIVGLLFNFSF